ncbi:hypothetical protein ACFS5M_02615 [Lacinutrix iliipiscaria]|uniref:Uncharacterized protein n=1 Tax=Lacinutrix iliipiscaria TaxID=1230532 RepID=A0ABW5WJY0_9FLAO
MSHLGLTDFEFEKKLSDCTLDPSIFSHEAHLRLAWIHIEKYGVEKAVNNVKALIRQYVKALDAEDKYNETVTVASVRAVNHFIKKSKTRNFNQFIKENKQLAHNLKGLLSSHYKTNIFESVTAKKQFIAPDLEPFN